MRMVKKIKILVQTKEKKKRRSKEEGADIKPAGSVVGNAETKEEMIIYHLQKIERHTFGIKCGIFLIIIYAFVLPVILRNL